jgi:hypothetical protein
VPSGPTTGAGDRAHRAWTGRPAIARAVRVVAFVLPAVVAWLVSAQAAPHLWRPVGAIGIVLSVIQLAVVGLLTVSLAGRLTRRLLPLATLLNLSLVFPDVAPSRFRTALRSGTIRNLQAQLDDFRRTTHADLNEVAAQMVEMVAALGRHERLTRGHTERVRAYSDLIAQEMGLSAHDRHLLQWSALLHDVGKLSVPPEILNKPGRPTDDEWAVLAAHPAVGGELVEPLAPWLGEWRLAAAEHHERWDGTGYPRGLAGTEISLAGRIVAVADAFDVITSHRSYKKPVPVEAARAELVRCAGSQFDPAVVRALVNASLGKRSVAAGSVGWLGQLQALFNAGAGGVASTAGNVAAATALAGAVAMTGAPLPADPDLSAPPPVVAEPFPGAARRLDALPAGAATSTPGAPSTTSTTTSPPAGVTDPAPRTAPGNAVDVTVRTGIPAPASPTTAPPTTTTRAATPTTVPPTTTRPPEAAVCARVRGGNADASGEDLTTCSFEDQTLRSLDLSSTDLRGALLRGATVTMASLRNADLRGADLRGAVFEGVDLEYVDLQGADLRGAVFRGVDLDHADLRQAKLDGARFGSAALGWVDFTGATGQPVDDGLLGWYRTRCIDGVVRDTACF